MGNLQPLACQRHQQDEQIPIRPFMAHPKRPCVTVLLSPPKRSSAALTLRRLILLQDWQRVLCRIALYPTELSQYMAFEVTSKHSLLVLPLHLACALNPPNAVISLMLELFVDAVAMPIRPVMTDSHKLPRKKHVRRLVAEREATESPIEHHRWMQWQRRYREWRRFRKGAFPTSECSSHVGDFLDAQESPEADDPSVFVTAVQDHESHIGTLDKASSSSISSRTSTIDKDMVLQLQPSVEDGPHLNLTPQVTDDTWSSKTSVDVTCTANFFRMHWSLEPLLKHVLQEGSLLPLHICCLYSASSEVVQAVAVAYPAAALREIVGMMPIHWVCAGWTLQPLLPQPTSSWPEPLDITEAKESPQSTLLQTLHTLETLRQTVPNSLHVRSGNHGMTPEDYIFECMEDGEYKDRCLDVVRTSAEILASDVEVDNVTFCSNGDNVFVASSEDNDDCDDGQSDVHTPLTSLLEARDWEGMLVAIESSPSMAARWIYGIDATACTVWKRLPLHLVCEHSDVPIGLVSILLQFYPDAAYAVDPLDGSCPLHIACRSNVSLPVLKLLLTKGPGAADIADDDGRVPLHWAVSSKASYEAIEALVAENPQSVSYIDADDMTPIDLAKDVYDETHVVYELLSMIHHYLNDPPFEVCSVEL